MNIIVVKIALTLLVVVAFALPFFYPSLGSGFLEELEILGIGGALSILGIFHIDEARHWAKHLLRLREQQLSTEGFTEFVPLPFVHMEAPMYRKGRSRRGPTWRESILMHAVARLVLHPVIPNIQTSWVKLGQQGIQACLAAGANDIGGTLMNETITRSAGAKHGQEMTPQTMESLLAEIGRTSRQRTTLYEDADNARQQASFSARKITDVLPIVRM